MYLFGGSGPKSPIYNPDLPVPSALWILDMKNLRWEYVNNAQGDIPISRDDHTSLVYENSMIVFGGFVEGERTNDIYRYHFRENLW